MTVYPCCKINKDVVIIGSNIVSLTAYFEWSESVGYNGNRTQCWDCWCESLINDELQEITKEEVRS